MIGRNQDAKSILRDINLEGCPPFMKDLKDYIMSDGTQVSQKLGEFTKYLKYYYNILKEYQECRTGLDGTTRYARSGPLQPNHIKVTFGKYLLNRDMDTYEAEEFLNALYHCCYNIIELENKISKAEDSKTSGKWNLGTILLTAALGVCLASIGVGMIVGAAVSGPIMLAAVAATVIASAILAPGLVGVGSIIKKLIFPDPQKENTLPDKYFDKELFNDGNVYNFVLKQLIKQLVLKEIDQLSLTEQDQTTPAQQRDLNSLKNNINSKDPNIVADAMKSLADSPFIRQAQTQTGDDGKVQLNEHINKIMQLAQLYTSATQPSHGAGRS